METLGIKENEVSVYDKFLDDVQFINGRYEVSLPFKENRPFVEDNYVLSEKRLRRLKNNLEKILEDKYERRPTLYLDIISWLESKLTDNTVEEIIKAKRV